MDNPRSPQQQAPCPICSSNNSHGCQHVVGRDPDTHCQTGRTLDVVAGFQAGHPSENIPTGAPARGRLRSRSRLSEDLTFFISAGLSHNISIALGDFFSTLLGQIRYTYLA